MWPFIIVGLVTGSIYGLSGVGLVLTYKISGVFNFAQGAIAAVGAYGFYFLAVDHGLNKYLAALIVLLILGPIVGLLFEPFARRLRSAPLSMQIAGTIGVLLAVQALAVITYGLTGRKFPSILPETLYEIGPVNVTFNQLVIVVLALVATLGLSLFFRRARMGVAMRAVVDDSSLLSLSGTNPTLVRRLAWIIGCCFAMLSGLLFAPSVNLNPTALTLLAIQAFGAAAIGSFTSLPRTYLGGLFIGLTTAILTKYVGGTSGVLAGLPASVPFIVLFVVLVIMPRGKLVARTVSVAKMEAPWRVPVKTRSILIAALAVFLCLVPQFAAVDLAVWSMAIVYAVLLLSLGLLVRISNQVSLCQMGFAAIGIVALAKLTEAGVPWLLAFLLAGLVAVPVGAVLAVPAIRQSGLFLALATFGFGLVLQNMFYNTDWMFGSDGSGVMVPQPDLIFTTLTTPENIYYFVLVIAALCALLITVLTRSRLGRLLGALGDSRTALVTGGASVNVTLVIVFCIAAFMASIAGGLGGVVLLVGSSSAFDPLLSLTLLALLLIIAGQEPFYAIIGGIAYAVIPIYIEGESVTQWLQVVFGVSAVLLAIAPASARGVPHGLRRGLERFEALLPSPGAGWFKRRFSRPEPAVAPRAAARTGALEVEGVRVEFGGIVAVSDANLSVPTGRITGMIGPNGAGKTTTFNACTGLNRPTRGHVRLRGKDISGMSPARRARAGLGRTFQQMELYDSFTVERNVVLGAEAAMAGANPFTQLLARRSEKIAANSAAAHAIEVCGLQDLAQRQVASLSTGQRRLVELARCLASASDVLLLDEPSSGLDHSETEEFGRTLKQAVRERGVGILLVEHDMSLVMDICDYVYVLDFGEMIFEGTAADVGRSPIVQAAYLGTEAGTDADVDADVETGIVEVTQS